MIRIYFAGIAATIFASCSQTAGKGMDILAPQDTAGMARTLLTRAPTRPVRGIAAPRYAQLVWIIGALDEGAYPSNEHRLLILSVIPYVFQEANWDNIDWGSRDSSQHRQLKDILEIDFLVQMGGMRREDASDAEMRIYRERSHRAIEFRKREIEFRKKNTEFRNRDPANHSDEPL
jgi:hypothetical protein